VVIGLPPPDVPEPLPPQETAMKETGSIAKITKRGQRESAIVALLIAFPPGKKPRPASDARTP
jgi:hypothetical protein